MNAPTPARTPRWTRTLFDLYRIPVAGSILTDPSFPLLVTAVEGAAAHTSTAPESLLTTARGLLGDPDQPGGTGREGLALSLAWVVTDIAYPPDLDGEPTGPRRPGLTADPEESVRSTSSTTVSRIVSLTEAAAQIYAQAYAGSTAAVYLRGRLGTDLIGTNWTVGYASPAWTTVVDALRAHHDATDTELIDAGLATVARTGSLIDRFRDRLTFGIRTIGGDLVGFTARAAPRAPAGTPKYLNTPTTAAFRKGSVLFGWAETARARAAGATPVRVEGALDAIAVSLSGGLKQVGLAPLGTALTDRQARLLAYAGRRTGAVLHCTDLDQAGRKAAAADHSRLVWHGVVPRQLILTAGTDPAAATALSTDLAKDHPLLACALVRDLVGDAGARGPEAAVHAARQAATITRTLPIPLWHEIAAATAHALGGSDGDIALTYTVLLEQHAITAETLLAAVHQLDTAPGGDLWLAAGRQAALEAHLGRCDTLTARPPPPPVTACFPHKARSRTPPISHPMRETTTRPSGQTTSCRGRE